MPATNTSLSVIDMRNLTEMALNVINRTLSIMDNHELFRQTEQEGMKENVVLTGLFGEHLSFIIPSVALANTQRTLISSLYGSYRGSRVDLSQAVSGPRTGSWVCTENPPDEFRLHY